MKRVFKAAVRPAAGAQEIVRFTAPEGADRHREPMGPLTRDARIFDRLDGYLDR
jgi:hypothetical protein